MVTPADVRGSRPLPRCRAGHIAKRLPSRRWDMIAPADVLGSRPLPRYRASHIAKRLPSRALGHGNTCRRSREPLAATLQSWPYCKAAPLQVPGSVQTMGPSLRDVIPADTRPIVLLSAFAAFRARSPRFLRLSRSRRITPSILRDLRDQ